MKRQLSESNPTQKKKQKASQAEKRKTNDNVGETIEMARTVLDEILDMRTYLGVRLPGDTPTHGRSVHQRRASIWARRAVAHLLVVDVMKPMFLNGGEIFSNLRKLKTTLPNSRDTDLTKYLVKLSGEMEDCHGNAGGGKRIHTYLTSNYQVPALFLVEISAFMVRDTASLVVEYMSMGEPVLSICTATDIPASDNTFNVVYRPELLPDMTPYRPVSRVTRKELRDIIDRTDWSQLWGYQCFHNFLVSDVMHVMGNGTYGAFQSRLRTMTTKVLKRDLDTPLFRTMVAKYDSVLNAKLAASSSSNLIHFH